MWYSMVWYIRLTARWTYHTIQKVMYEGLHIIPYCTSVLKERYYTAPQAKHHPKAINQHACELLMYSQAPDHCAPLVIVKVNVCSAHLSAEWVSSLSHCMINLMYVLVVEKHTFLSCFCPKLMKML